MKSPTEPMTTSAHERLAQGGFETVELIVFGMRLTIHWPRHEMVVPDNPALSEGAKSRFLSCSTGWRRKNRVFIKDPVSVGRVHSTMTARPGSG